LYEAWNLAALWGVPQLFVCENNLYSQSTPQPLAVAGTLRGRASAFGIKTFECNTWDLPSLFATAREAIEDVRERQAPALLIVRTYRLNAHSKGDDDRTQNEVRFFQAQDPLNRLLGVERWQRAQDEIKAEVAGHVEASRRVTLDVADYVGDQLPRYRLTSADDPGRPVENERVRLVHALNRAYKARVEAGAVMLGEDIHDPYGGAFKVTKGIAEAHRDRVYTTPISEAGIAGIGAGLALMGQRAFVEIMFGDFTTNIFDQLINNISKFHHMYAKQASVPIRIRTPMGGKRGYGPTHSQSLEKYLVGIDNLTVMAVTSLEDPFAAIKAADELPGPVFIVESKLDYGRFLWQPPAEYACQKVGPALGTLVISPRRHAPTVTVVSYGETARELAEGLIDLFVEADEVVELVVPLLLHPLPLESILRSVMRTGNLLVVEDGSVPFGIGSEVIASLVEAGVAFKARRLGAEPVPIPSVLELEKQALPSARRVLQELLRAKGGSMQ
jgi:2-oxoisovalerate dehydrogenase E1 component